MRSLQVILKIQKGIRDYEDELVKKIEEAFKKEKGALDPSQYQNLVQVALSTESPEVIKNFLRYQTGRDKKWGQGKGSLAEAIIKDIGDEKDIQTKSGISESEEENEKLENRNLKQQAKIIAQEAGDISKQKEVHIELIRRYLGYGKRHLIYLRSLKDESITSQSSRK